MPDDSTRTQHFARRVGKGRGQLSSGLTAFNFRYVQVQSTGLTFLASETGGYRHVAMCATNGNTAITEWCRSICQSLDCVEENILALNIIDRWVWSP